MSDDLLSFETTGSRADIVAMVHAIADGFDDGETLQVTLEDESIAVPLAESISFELEIERESSDEDEDEIELEMELKWNESTGRAERADSRSADLRPSDEQEPDSESDETPAREIETVAGDDRSDPSPSESMGTFQLFEDRSNEWRWRLVHRNGNIIATSGEGYTTKQNARKGIRSVLRNAPGAEVIDQSDSTSG